MRFGIGFLTTVIVCCCSVETSLALTVPTIPSHLWSCYKKDGPNITAPHRLDVFLEVLKKLENHKGQLDIRLFSVALLRSLRLDGIEQAPTPIETQYNIPFRASAFQFQRFKLMMDLFLPGQSFNIMDEDLSDYEMCYVHQMLSQTIDRWERGDESLVCPLSMTDLQRDIAQRESASRRGYSRCPIEKGVIQTDFGSVAIGTLIAGIAAGLERQNVLLNDVLNTDVFREEISKNSEVEDMNILNEIASTPSVARSSIDNLWIATIAGDLAEVAVAQGPRIGVISPKFEIGTTYNWNDTSLPRKYYILLQNASDDNQQFTDAELLAGIDGLIIANEIMKWVSERPSVKLSQVIDMYYTAKGISFNPDIKACNRMTNFNAIFDKQNMIEQTRSFALILALTQGTVVVNEDQIDAVIEAAVEALVSYTSLLFEKNSYDCSEKIQNIPDTEIILAIDGTWKSYANEQFISKLSKDLEISLSRSSLGLLHGGTGEWILNPTPNMTDAFSSMYNYTGQWPNRLDYPKVISNLNTHLNTIQNNTGKTYVDIPIVVIIISPTDRLSENDLQTSREYISSLRKNHPDIYFIYVAQDLSGYKEATDLYFHDKLDFFVQIDSINVVDIEQKIVELFNQLEIPKRIVGVCSNSTETPLPYWDYVLADQVNHYVVTPAYYPRNEVAFIQFKALGQGDISICRSCDLTTIDESPDCETLGLRETFLFNLTKPCDGSALRFSVKGLTTGDNCVSENCRFSYQIGYSIEPVGLVCLNACISWRNTYILIITLFLLYIR